MNLRIVFVGSSSTRGKLALGKGKKEERKLKGSGRVKSREFGVHLRTETTRSSSSMENACVIAIEPRG